MDPSDAGLRRAAVRHLAGPMVDGRERLESVRTRLTVIAYPHGVADERVASAARRAGYRAGFVLNERTVTATDDPLLLGRRGARTNRAVTSPADGRIGSRAGDLINHRVGAGALSGLRTRAALLGQPTGRCEPNVI